MERQIVHTGFKPEVHGFAFNNTWNLDLPSIQAFKWLAASTLALSSVSLLSQRTDRKQRRTFLAISTLTTLVLFAFSNRTRSFRFGLCGGMSFSAVDYFRSGKTLPRGVEGLHPTSQSAEGNTIRHYIWKRALQSLQANTMTFLKWMTILHFYSHGKNILKSLTRTEFEKLKMHLDKGNPWPLGLVGTTWSPFINHQVVATGYEEHANGAIIYLYDSNCPSVMSQINLQYKNDELTLCESCASERRGKLMGFFCEDYTPRDPRS